MPVPSSIADLSTTPGSNSPLGGEPPGVIDDYLRTHASFIKVLSNAGDATAATAAATAATVAGIPAPVDLTTNQTVNGSKTFSNGVGVAGQAADETGWTLTGYLRGLLLPATRAIWWAKGAATRSIGIVRQSGSNLLRFVSSTADDGTAAAFDALTVDMSSGNLVSAGKITPQGGIAQDTVFVRDAGNPPTTGGSFQIDIGSTGALAGRVFIGSVFAQLAIGENGGTFRGIKFDIDKAATSFDSKGVFIVAESIGVNGWRKWSNGVIEQWGTSALEGDLPGGVGLLARSIAWPVAFTAAIDTVNLQVNDEGGSPNSVVTYYRKAATTLSTLNYYVLEVNGAAQSNWSVSFYARGR